MKTPIKMDSAYDAAQIHDHSRKHGRVSIIDTNPRSNKGLKEALARERKAAKKAGFVHPTIQRYGERTTVERVNGRLKDEFGTLPLAGAWTQKCPGAPDVQCCCALCRSDNAVVDLDRIPNQIKSDHRQTACTTRAIQTCLKRGKFASVGSD